VYKETDTKTSHGSTREKIRVFPLGKEGGLDLRYRDLSGLGLDKISERRDDNLQLILQRTVYFVG
jgi:hypothetical protein